MAAISIAVPVYNGEALLREALECLRRQTFTDFEVLILDNCSTDGTREIAQEFVDSDTRFRLLVQPSNKGAMGNFVDGFNAARADYFLWRAFDDITDDNYLEELHAALVARPDAKLAVGTVRSVYLDGAHERIVTPPRLVGVELMDITRLMFGSHAAWFYGLWNREALRPVFEDMLRAFPHPWASDHLILFPFLLDRSVAFAPNTTFTIRIKRTADGPRVRRRRPAAEMMMFRRDFATWCGARIDERFSRRPAARGFLHAALWFYTNKRVYRLRTVARRAITEKFRREQTS